MQQQFVIYNNEKINAANCCLAMHVGNQYFTYAIYNSSTNTLLQLKHYRLQQLTADALNDIINANAILGAAFSKIVTAVDFGVNTLLPADYCNGDYTPLLYLNDANQQDHVITEIIDGHNIANIYTIPYNLLNGLVHNFPSSGFMHLQSLFLKCTPSPVEQSILKVDFANDVFHVLVLAAGNVLLAKSYTYNSADDVIFYLLKICETYNLDQQTVKLQLSGFIEKQSKLYKELYDYFIDINFVQPHWQMPQTTYPAHYFTTLNQLAVCELLQEI